jgi:sulfur-oxidizing protein SoxX
MRRKTGALKFAATGAAAGGAALAASLLGGGAVAQESLSAGLVPYTVVGSTIPRPLTAIPGDPVNGSRVAMNRELGDCVLCHALPDMPAGSLHGNVGPPLAGVGSRLNAAQLRMRLVDPTRINPDSVMPAYYRVEHLTQVASAYRGKPVLTAQQIEDVIAYLQGLR